MARFETPCQVASLFVCAALVSVAVIFVLRAEAAKRYGDAYQADGELLAQAVTEEARMKQSDPSALSRLRDKLRTWLHKGEPSHTRSKRSINEDQDYFDEISKPYNDGFSSNDVSGFILPSDESLNSDEESEMHDFNWEKVQPERSAGHKIRHLEEKLDDLDPDTDQLLGGILAKFCTPKLEELSSNMMQLWKELFSDHTEVEKLKKSLNDRNAEYEKLQTELSNFALNSSTEKKLRSKRDVVYDEDEADESESNSALLEDLLTSALSHQRILDLAQKLDQLSEKEQIVASVMKRFCQPRERGIKTAIQGLKEDIRHDEKNLDALRDKLNSRDLDIKVVQEDIKDAKDEVEKAPKVEHPVPPVGVMGAAVLPHDVHNTYSQGDLACQSYGKIFLTVCITTLVNVIIFALTLICRTLHSESGNNWHRFDNPNEDFEGVEAAEKQPEYHLSL